MFLGNRLPGPAADPLRDVSEFIAQFQRDYNSNVPFMDSSYGDVIIINYSLNYSRNY